MRDAAGDAAQRLQLLRLAQPRLGPVPLGHVEQHRIAVGEAAGGIVLRPGPDQHVHHLAVGAEHAVLHLAHLVAGTPQLGQRRLPAARRSGQHELPGPAAQHLLAPVAEEGQPFAADPDQPARGIDRMEGRRGAVVDPPQLALARRQFGGALGHRAVPAPPCPQQRRLGPLAVGKVEDEGDGVLPRLPHQGEADQHRDPAAIGAHGIPFHRACRCPSGAPRRCRRHRPAAIPAGSARPSAAPGRQCRAARPTMRSRASLASRMRPWTSPRSTPIGLASSMARNSASRAPAHLRSRASVMSRLTPSMRTGRPSASRTDPAGGRQPALAPSEARWMRNSAVKVAALGAQRRPPAWR